MNAIDIPLKVAQLAHDALPLAAAMAKDGNPNSVTDAGVGAMCLRTAVMGAVLNARINCGDLEDQAKVAEVQQLCAQLWRAPNPRGRHPSHGGRRDGEVKVRRKVQHKKANPLGWLF